MSHHDGSWTPRCPHCKNPLPKILRDYPSPGTNGEMCRLEVYPARSLYEPGMPVLGHLNSQQAAAFWGVTMKTFYAAVPELRALGIVSGSIRAVRVDTALFVLGWVHGCPERKRRADLLRERDERRRRGERLPLGRPPKEDGTKKGK